MISAFNGISSTGTPVSFAPSISTSAQFLTPKGYLIRAVGSYIYHSPDGVQWNQAQENVNGILQPFDLAYGDPVGTGTISLNNNSLAVASDGTIYMAPYTATNGVYQNCIAPFYSSVDNGRTWKNNNGLYGTPNMGFKTMMGTGGVADGLAGDPSTIAWYPASSRNKSYCYVSSSNPITSDVIRHTHGIFIDLNDTLWALTGDLGFQAGFWTWSSANNSWIRMTPAESNLVLSQQWRALSMQERKQTLYWGVDTGGKTPGRILSATASQLISCRAGDYCPAVTTVANLPTGAWFSAKTSNNVILFGGVSEGQVADSRFYQPGGTIELTSESNDFNPNQTPLPFQNPDSAVGPMGYGQCAIGSMNATNPTLADVTGAEFSPSTPAGTCHDTDGGDVSSSANFQCRCYEEDEVVRLWSIDQNNKVTQIWSGSPSSNGALGRGYGKINTLSSDPTGRFVMFSPLNMCWPGAHCVNEIIRNGSTSLNSATIKVIGGTEGVELGWFVTGSGVAAGSVVIGIDEDTITMSKVATSSLTSTTIYLNQATSYMNVGAISVSH